MALACAVLLAPAPAWGGAWPKARGEGLLIVTSTLDHARRSFDAHGRPVEAVRFDKTEVSAYAEYGLGWRLTAVARAAIQDVRIENSMVKERVRGLGAVEAGLRTALIRRDWDVLSLQVSLIKPGQTDNGTEWYLGEGDWGYETRILYGRSFRLAGGDGYVEAQAAWRRRGGPPADETRLAASLGWGRGRWFGRVQASGFEALDADPSGSRNHASVKLQASVSRRIGAGARLELGAFRTMAGRSIVRETAMFAALWREF